MSEKSLICINSCCGRLDFVKAFAPGFLAFCQQEPAFDFILALDGNDPDYLAFCRSYQIPVLYSEQREGVGLAKNRVLTQWPNYQHYFFFDDDVELVDAAYFAAQIAIAKQSGIPHFSLHKLERLLEQGPAIQLGQHRILQAKFGGAPVNYFSKEGLDQVGGWHTRFAQYRRWGHTEHSYRYVNQGLKEYAFHLVETLLDCFLFYDPPSSVVVPGALITKEHIAQPEKELMTEKLHHFPVTTICSFHLEGLMDQKLDKLMAKTQHQAAVFPLLQGPNRNRLLSLRLLSQSSGKELSIRQKLVMVARSLLLSPTYMTKDKISVLKKILFRQW